MKKEGCKKKGAPSWRCRVLPLWTKTPCRDDNPLEYLAKRLQRGSDHLSWCYQKLPRCRSWRIRALSPRWIVLSDKNPNVLGAVLMLWDDCLESSMKWDSPRGLNIRCLLRHTRLTTPCHEPMNCTKRQCFFYATPQQRHPTNVILKDQAGWQMWKQMNNIIICSVYIYSNIIPNVLARHLLMWL